MRVTRFLVISLSAAGLGLFGCPSGSPGDAGAGGAGGGGGGTGWGGGGGGTGGGGDGGGGTNDGGGTDGGGGGGGDAGAPDSGTDLKPSIVLASPLDGTTVSGTVALHATASDDHGIKKVEFLVGAQILATVTSSPYDATWDTLPSVNGNYYLTARATDTADQTADATVQVFVANSSGADQPPSVNLIYPVANSKVCGTVNIEAAATDDIGVAQVEFWLDGQSLGVDTSSPFQKAWATSGVPGGSHALQAVATDTGGNKAQHTIQVRVDNTSGTTCDNLPSIAFTAPTSAYINGTSVALSATASDDVGVVKVQFFIDNGLIAEDNIAPYGASWATGGFAEGAHTLKAVAYDTANQLGSDVRQVTLDSTAPAVAITSPAPGSVVGSAFTVACTATDTYGVDRVEVRVSGTLAGTATVAPYTVNVTGASSGTRSLVATAYDRAGNSKQSTSVSVTVDAPPTVSITAPASGASVKGTVNLTASATDDLGVTQVEFFLDSSSLGVDTTQPYGLSWDTKPTANGSYTLKAVATDTHGQTTQAQIPITIADAAPTVALTAPASGASVKGTVNVTATASDDLGVTQVEFFLDSTSLGIDSTSPYALSWNTSSTTNAAYTLKAVATDTKGQTTVAQIPITVADLTPTVSFTAPAASSTVSGTVTLSANATDDVGINQLEFKPGGASIGFCDSSPCSLPWVTCSTPDGTASVQAVATDTQGKTATATISVTVNNSTVAPVAGASSANTKATVSWTKCGSATSFNLYWSTSPGVTSASTKIASVTSPYLHSGLTNGQDYYYRVAALNGTTVGPLSNEVHAKPGQRICSADGWCWENPTPQGNGLNAVWGTGASNVYAVGDNGTVLRWDGSSWSAETSGTTAKLTSIWGSSASDIWIAGESILLHGNGSTWTEDAYGTTNCCWAGIWASGPSDVWAVGEGIVVRWNGSAWGPVAGAPTGVNNAVWGTSATNVFIADLNTAISHWNGTAWSSDATGGTRGFWALWGTGPGDVWAGGMNDVAHYDGSTWTATPLTTTRRLGVWGTSATNVWTVGGTPSYWAPNFDGSIQHWDGSTWTTPLDNVESLMGTWGSGAGNAWAVGAVGAAYHWAGASWSNSTASASAQDLKGVWAESPGDVWAVGNATLLHSNGSGWTPSTSTTETLNGVWASAANDAWTVGNGGAILHWNGTTWSAKTSGTGVNLNAVGGTGPSDAWAVGDNGTIVHWTSAWAGTPSDTGNTLYAVWAVSPTDAWAGGDNGTLVRWNGTGWASATSSTTYSIFGLWGTASNDVWAVTYKGSVLHWNGSAWSAETFVTYGNLNGVWGSATNDIWAAGDYGSLVHWDGSSWTAMAAGTGNPFYGVSGAGAADVWVVGGTGTILRLQ